MATDNNDVPRKMIKIDNTKCIRCNTILRKISGPKKEISQNETVSIATCIDKPVTVGDKLCLKCWKVVNKTLRSFRSVEQKETNSDNQTQEQFQQDQNRTYDQEQVNIKKHI